MDVTIGEEPLYDPSFLPPTLAMNNLSTLWRLSHREIFCPAIAHCAEVPAALSSGTHRSAHDTILRMMVTHEEAFQSRQQLSPPVAFTAFA
jgi:hypothetical protein